LETKNSCHTRPERGGAKSSSNRVSVAGCRFWPREIPKCDQDQRRQDNIVVDYDKDDVPEASVLRPGEGIKIGRRVAWDDFFEDSGKQDETHGDSAQDKSGAASEEELPCGRKIEKSSG
jgi:hypothetical protein